MAPAINEGEVAFISGVAENGTVVSNSYWTMLLRAVGNTVESFATKWGSGTPSTGADVTYSFASASNWTASEQAAWQGGLALWSAVANIKFTETADAAGANFRIIRGNDGAFADFFRQDVSGVGDNILAVPKSTGSTIRVDTNTESFGPIGQDLTLHGGYPLITVVHEVGHIINLGHAGLYNGAVDATISQLSPYDTKLWSLMSYISPMEPGTKYFDQYPVTGTNWGVVFDTGRFWNYEPQTPMALDILAAQRLYGAATSGPLASGGKVFGFNANIDGYIGRFYDFSINQHPVLELWSGGTGNTLDLSGFSADATINLTPGTFSSAAGLKNNIGIAFGTVIETAIGGGGNDTILGTDLSNVLKGGAGNDLILGGAGNDRIWGDSGNDVLSGGSGADIIDPGTGTDIIRDRLIDLNSDMIFGFGRATTVDITGSLIGRDALTVTQFGSTTAIGAAGLSFGLNGLYSGGDFMSVAQGSGANAHTMVTFVNYLPNLAEGLRVNPAAINGIANEPFLGGDGSIGFTVNFKSAVSAHSNTLGVYKFAADGSITDVHIVFANTLAVASNTTVSLGTPGNGEHIGFFLIQDGFDRYGSLPDNLSFVAPQGGAPPVLVSATQGVLTAVPVFHSSAGLNPGHTTPRSCPAWRRVAVSF